MEDGEADRIAERAVEDFLGRPATSTLLGHGESVTHRVEAGGETFLLRLHVPLHAPFDPLLLAPEALASECAWLAALRRDTDVVAPEPVRAPDGSYLVRVEEIACSLLRWVEGETIDGQPTAEQAACLGRLLAALQDHASRWIRPEGFVRPTHDRRWRREAIRRLERLAREGVLVAGDVDRLEEALDLFEREVDPWLEDPLRSGLIHADLHEDNYVIHRGQARPIDFGRCGFGPWLYDLAECAMHLLPDRRRDLVEAYASIRSLSDGDLRRIEGFLVAAVIETYGHHAPNSDEHASLAKSLASVAGRHVRRYLDGEPFLFDL